MVNQLILDYLKKEEAQGYTEQQLKIALLQQGYPEAEIDEAIQSVNAQPEPKPETQPDLHTEVQPEAQHLEPSVQTISTGALKYRDPIKVVLLSVATMGLYVIYWMFVVSKELKDDGKDIPNRIFMFLPIISWWFIWKFFKAVNEETGYSHVLLVLLYISVFPVSIFLTQQELNKKVNPS